MRTILVLAAMLVAGTAQAWQLEPSVAFGRAGDLDYTLASSAGTYTEKVDATSSDYVLALKAIFPVSERVDIRPRVTLVEQRDTSEERDNYGYSKLDTRRTAASFELAVRIRFGKDAKAGGD